MIRYNIYDLESHGLALTDRLKSILAKFDIAIDETKQDRKAIWSNVWASLDTSKKAIEFKRAFDANDPLLLKGLNEEENNRNRDISRAISTHIIERIEKEAIALQLQTEKLKEMQLKIIDLEKRIGDERFKMQMENYIRDKSDIENQYKQLLQRMQTEQAARLQFYEQEKDRLNNEINELNKQKQVLIAALALSLTEKHKNYTTDSGIKIFENVAPDVQTAFHHGYFEGIYNLESETEKNELTIVEINKELENKAARIAALDKAILDKRVHVAENSHESAPPYRADGRPPGFVSGFKAKQKSAEDPELKQLIDERAQCQTKVNSLNTEKSKLEAKVKQAKDGSSRIKLIEYLSDKLNIPNIRKAQHNDLNKLGNALNEDSKSTMENLRRNDSGIKNKLIQIQKCEEKITNPNTLDDLRSILGPPPSLKQSP